MKLGFVSAILPDLSLDEVLKFASQNGFSCVEIMCWPKGKAERRYAGVTHIDVTGLSRDQATKIQDQVKKSGVEISGLGYYPNPLVPDAKEAQVYIDHLKEVIKAAKLLGIGVVNTFIGRDWTKTVDENWPRFKQVWPPIIQFAEEQGVKIAIENCPMFFTRDEWPGGKNLAHSPAVWRRMFAEIPSEHFGLNFDPSHLVWQGIDYLRAIREFAPRIFHAHAKDCRVDRHRLNEVGILATPLEFHTPKLPGLGDVKWGKYISVLGDAGYNGPVCIEVEDRAFEGSLENRKAALIQSGTHLRQFIAP
ncbi:sugar phosphate isomerase/epimerase [bacterium]|nr:sugar phosphate isomerase/epimerase [bacterium]